MDISSLHHSTTCGNGNVCRQRSRVDGLSRLVMREPSELLMLLEDKGLTERRVTLDNRQDSAGSRYRLHEHQSMELGDYHTWTETAVCMATAGM